MKEASGQTRHLRSIEVELTDNELNYAVAQWVAAQPEASEEVKRIVRDGAHVALTTHGGGRGATLRLTKEIPPSLKIVGGE